MSQLGALLARGKAARAAGDDAAALAAFTAAVLADPAHHDARAEAAASLLALGRSTAAQTMFAAILAEAPWHVAALAGRAQAARQRGDRAAALRWTECALHVAPEHLGLRLGAAYDRLALGRLAAAEADFAAVAAAAPGDARGWLGLGHVARHAGDRAAALARFRDALAAAPADVQARLEVAAELAEADDTAAAAELVGVVLAVQPDNLQARLQLGHLARQASDHAAALAAFQRAETDHPGHPAPRIAAAETLLALGRPAEAEQRLQAVLAEWPNDMSALLAQSEIAWLAQDLERCLALALTAMAAHPAEPAPVLQATRALMDLGRTGEALALLRPAGERLAWPPALRTREGEILRRDGHWAAAAATLAAAGDDYGAWAQRVLLHLTIHQLDAAAALLATAPARTPFQRAYAAHLRGQVAEARWDFAAAAAGYGAAMTEDPSLGWPHAELARVRLLQLDLHGCAHHQARALELDGAAHRLRGQRMRVTSTHLGQIWDEIRADARLVARLRPLLALPPDERVAALRDVLRAEPDTTAPSLLLLVALRQAGMLGMPAADAAAAVPRVIVQFWDAATPPDDVAALMASWPRLHPDWEYRRFDLAAAGAWLRDHAAAEVQRAYRRAPRAAQQADIFRLAWLAREGGVWADADDRCLAPVTALVAPGVRLAGWQESFGSIGNNLLAAAPGHPAILGALALAVAAVNAGDEDIPWLATGPGALTRALAQAIAADAGVLDGLLLLERGAAAQLASFHHFAAYKRTKQHWLRAAFTEG